MIQIDQNGRCLIEAERFEEALAYIKTLPTFEIQKDTLSAGLMSYVILKLNPGEIIGTANNKNEYDTLVKLLGNNSIGMIGVIFADEVHGKFVGLDGLIKRLLPKNSPILAYARELDSV